MIRCIECEREATVIRAGSGRCDEHDAARLKAISDSVKAYIALAEKALVEGPS